jgi:hypothetical protein
MQLHPNQDLLLFFIFLLSSVLFHIIAILLHLQAPKESKQTNSVALSPQANYTD